MSLRLHLNLESIDASKSCIHVLLRSQSRLALFQNFVVSSSLKKKKQIDAGGPGLDSGLIWPTFAICLKYMCVLWDGSLSFPPRCIFWLNWEPSGFLFTLGEQLQFVPRDHLLLMQRRSMGSFVSMNYTFGVLWLYLLILNRDQGQHITRIRSVSPG